MPDIAELTINALRCLEIGGQSHAGDELVIVYDGNNRYKKTLAHAMEEQALKRDVNTSLHDLDILSEGDPEKALLTFQQRARYLTSNPLERNAINLLPPTGQYAPIRRRLLLDTFVSTHNAYVLAMPFTNQETAH